MCGFVGILHRERDREIDQALLGRMNSVISHRGPDDSGFYIDRGLGLAHRRLAIMDLHAGHQPMIDRDRQHVIAYNGEIYNHQELRTAATFDANTPFETNCDTEVLLKMASTHSHEWLEDLNGMFAFALWSMRERTLFLARDRLGIKPLYYMHLGDEFLFSSEIKPLLLHPKVHPEVNIDRVPEYLAFRSINGEETLFKGIFELRPGCAMRISQNEFTPRTTEFWSEGVGNTIASYTDSGKSVEEQFDDLLRNSVRYRLISDVPVGSYNSGGVDSSFVSSVMRSLTDGELHTFSVGFEEAEYDERKYAKIVADHLGTNHHTLVVNESQYVENIDRALRHLEEPINHAHTVQLLLLSEFARQYVTVVLTGEGADELFGGYPRLQIPLLAQYLSFLPEFVLKGARVLGESLDQRKLVKLMESGSNVDRSVIENSRYVPVADFSRLYPGTVSFPERERILQRSKDRGGTFMQQVLHFDQRSYLPSLLTRLDKVSMAHSLECRVPFLDYNLVEWSYLLPDKYKMRVGRENKYIVKKAAEKWLPREIVYREKVGFGTPVGKWFRNSQGLGRYLDYLTDDTFRERGIFDSDQSDRLVHEHLKEGRDHSEILWGLMNFELWCRTFIDDVPM